MSLLKGIGSLFFEDETANAPAPQPVDEQPTAEQSAAPAPTPAPPSDPVGGVFDQETFDKLMQAIIDNDMEGYDYLEFKEGIKAMQAVPLQEEDKFKAVYAAAQSMKVTTDVLVSSVDHYLKVLEAEREKFDELIQHQTDAEIVTRQAKKEENEKSIETMTEEIKSLTEKINATQEENIQLTIDISGQNGKISNASSSFGVTYDAVVNQITKDKDKIVKYLSEDVEGVK